MYFRDFYDERLDKFLTLYDDDFSNAVKDLYDILDKGKDIFVAEYRGLLPEVEMLADRVLAAKAFSEPRIVLPSGKHSKANEMYFDAIRKGDYAAAERMVENAAQTAGYTLDAWHASDTQGILFSRLFPTTSLDCTLEQSRQP